MNNRGSGRGFMDPNGRSRPGNRPGFNSKYKSPPSGQRSRDDNAGQDSSPVNHESGGAQPPGFGNGGNKYGNRNHCDNRQQRGQRPGVSSHGNKPRAFNMSPNSSGDTDFDQKSTNSGDDFKDRSNKSRMGSLQSAKARLDKTSRNSNDSDKSSISPPTYTVVTESGVFECSTEFPAQNESRQSGSNNAEGFNIKRKQSCVTEVEGDLFSAPENVSLAHCVGADLRMGSGVALKFRRQFKSVGKLFDQRVEPGGVATIPFRGKHIFYLITKRSSTDKPTIETTRQSLLALREKCKELNVTQLAMPQIGCGLDGLSWIDVKQMLEEIFADGFAITVYKMDTDFVETRITNPKCRVVNNKLMLKDILPGTGLLYIGYENAHVSEEMQSINEKYPFLSRLKNLPHRLGTAVYTTAPRDDTVYGLICKEQADSPLSYEHLEAAIGHLKYFNKKHGYEYFGLQAFEEKDDPYVMEKIDTLFRNSSIDAEFWICWPPSMVHKPLPNLEQNDSAKQVQESQCAALGNRQSNSPRPSGSSKKPKDSLRDNNSPKNPSKGSNNPKDSNSQDKAVREVEEKMNSQSLDDKSKSVTDYSETKNEDTNTNEMDWDHDDKLLAELPDPVDSTLDTDEGGWYEDEHAEKERRKSKEKKNAKQLAKEKEKQDRRSVDKPKSCVTEFKGDLFEAEDTMCLAHCVGADFRMGSGIAVIFRREFRHLAELLDQRVGPGGVAYIQIEKRYIFYLVTKRESTGKPTYETLENSLIELRKICKQLNVTELAMPRIGCGLDRLDWSRVKKMLEDIFADGFSIKIYNLEKDYKETPQSMPKTTIKNEALYLKDIALGTGLIYIGTVTPYESEEMKSLDEKYRFLQRLEKTQQKLGTVVRTEASYPREIVYGLICKQSPNDRVSFVHLHAALKQLRKLSQNEKYHFYGIQAVEDKRDDNLMGKIETLFRYSYIEAEVWICFPPSLKHLMSTSSMPPFSPNTSGNGRSSWVEADNKRMAAMLRDMQQTQEATYRRLISLEDVERRILGPDGLKATIDQNISRINELVGVTQELSDKIDTNIHDIALFYQCYEALQAKCATLETTKQDLDRKVELLEAKNQDFENRLGILEQRLQPAPHSVDQRYYINMNGNYSSSSIPDGPVPLVQSSTGPPVWSPTGDYYPGNVQFVHPGYTPQPQFYATDQLPEEKEALIRAAKNSADKYGHVIKFSQSGIIFMKKKGHHEFKPICSHGDLSAFENSRN